MGMILNTILPVFGLILLGFVAFRLKLVDETASRGLGSFVFGLAIPAFLFRTVATLSAQEGAPWRLWLVFFSALAICWLFTTVIAQKFPALGLSAGGGAAAGMGACFGNLALLGTPLVYAHFGSAVAFPLGMILSIHAPVLWTVATLHRELTRQDHTLSLPMLLRDLIINLLKNTIIQAIILASLWRMTGLGLNPILDKMLKMLGEASIPTALVALGLSLGSYSFRRAITPAFFLILCKMLLAPLCVIVLVKYVIDLPRNWAEVALVLAAMPTGANAFLFAQKYRETESPISMAIALGTALSALSISFILFALEKGWI